MGALFTLSVQEDGTDLAPFASPRTSRMTPYDIMYLIGGAVGITCLAVFFDPVMSLKTRLITVALLLGGFGIAAYLVLGDSPIPENPMFPILIHF